MIILNLHSEVINEVGSVIGSYFFVHIQVNPFLSNLWFPKRPPKIRYANSMTAVQMHFASHITSEYALVT